MPASPLWAGLAMLPLTARFLISGPLSGILSDRFGARPLATGGMIGTAVAFVLLELLPVNFGEEDDPVRRRSVLTLAGLAAPAAVLPLGKILSRAEWRQ